jgi:2-Cys peroxiredoxin 5
VDPAEEFGSGKVIIFAVPGAFTPGCSNTHLPGYVNDFDAIKAKGVDQIACVAVNDAFVMNAWGEAHGANGKIRMLADPLAEFTKALGLDVDAAALGGVRSKRYAMVLEDGKVTQLEVEPGGFGLTCSLSESIIEKL